MFPRIKLPRLRGRDAGDAPPPPPSAPQAESAPSAPQSDPAPEAAPAAEPTPAAGSAPDAGAPTPTSATETAAAAPGPEQTAAPAPSLGPLEPQPSRFERWRRPALITAAVLVAGGAGLAAGYALFDESDASVRLPAVAPTVVIDEVPQPEAAEQLGFPAFATQNTTRVGGVDPIADAAGVALASYPAIGGVGGPRLAVIAPADSWQASLAASSLAAKPIGAPILLGRSDEIPGFTAEALSGLSPTGLKRVDDTQVVAIGGVAVPEDLKELTIDETDPAELANAIDEQRAELSGRKDPDHILVTSAEDAGFAMPAAAWAARSGDPIAFADGDEVPDATIEILDRHPDARVYVLGPGSLISGKAMQKLERKSGAAIRIAGEDPVSNAIEFARFVDGDFGWNINDPGHGFSIANIDRPADAGAAAPLAAGGKPGPMLLTDSADEIPRDLRNFLLDTKPGFSDDPVRAVYNHVWLLGDTSAISLQFQAQVDTLTELERISSGAGVPDFGAAPGTPEAEVDPDDDKPRP